MLLILSDITDPLFNIAAEEYLFKNFHENILMLYINEPSVIIGKHQNTLAEINYRFIKKNNIKVIRRISGGGAVYHDKGNLNFSFIENASDGSMVNFNKFTKPVIEVIQQYGIHIQLYNKNSLSANGLKVSGNAEHVFKNKVLHHGTMLVSANLKNLHGALNIEPGKYIDNAVKSVQSEVANINRFTNKPIDLAELQIRFLQYFRQKNVSTDYHFSNNDINNIEKLIEQKYSTWEWNFGYSPNYTFYNKTTIQKKLTEIKLKVEKSLIIEAEISGFNKTGESITGKRHEYNDVCEALKHSLKLPFDDIEEIAWKFF